MGKKKKETKTVAIHVTLRFEVDALADHDEIATAVKEEINAVLQHEDIFDTAFSPFPPAEGRATYVGYTVNPAPR